jgi:hypothetical protein
MILEFDCHFLLPGRTLWTRYRRAAVADDCFPGPTKEPTVAIGLIEPPIDLLAASSPALRAATAAQQAASTTHLRCGGCQADARYTQNQPGYGRLVHAFLGRHEPCGNAVKITCG